MLIERLHPTLASAHFAGPICAYQSILSDDISSYKLKKSTTLLLEPRLNTFRKGLETEDQCNQNEAKVVFSPQHISQIEENHHRLEIFK